MSAHNDFYHHLRDTIILLGGGTEIANLAAKPGEITGDDVEALRNHNCRLITQAKDRLVNLNYLAVRPSGD